MRIYLAVQPRRPAGAPPGLSNRSGSRRLPGGGRTPPCCGRNLLLQSCGSPAGRGGLLVLSDCAAPPIQRPEALAGAVLRECSRRGYSGAVLDFEAPPTEDRRRFAAVLGRRCAESRRSLVPPGSLRRRRRAAHGTSSTPQFPAAVWKSIFRRSAGCTAARRILLWISSVCECPSPSPPGTAGENR